MPGVTNYGCGSSREHVPFALMKAGVKAVIAESYARIFYRNSVDGGFLVPLEAQEVLIDKINTGHEVEINLNSYQLKHISHNKIYNLKSLGDVLAVVQAGGLFKYARMTIVE